MSTSRGHRPAASVGGTADLAVEARGLRREYQRRGRAARGRGPLVALDDLDLEVRVGEVHGLLGPNGAGKTTLCKILSTVLLPTSGTATVAGHDVVRETAAVRDVIGIVFGGDTGLYQRLTARQNLDYWGALYKLGGREARRRSAALLDRLGLAGAADGRVETFSRGMKQRLHLARALMGDPRVLVLDEPTSGMDPVAAAEVRRLVADLRDEGRTILLTTHDMHEAESLCERVTLIDHGRCLATESPRTIGRWVSAFERVDARGVDDALLARIGALPGVGEVARRDDGGVRIHTTADGATLEVLRLLTDAGVTSVATSLPTLEEVYLHLVGDRGLEV